MIYHIFREESDIMPHPVKIISGDITIKAELNDSSTAQAIKAVLPVSALTNRWGDEIYFAVPVNAEEEPDARSEMEIGELAFWPPGRAFCIFFGVTPLSINEKPRAASLVNPIGKLLDPVDSLLDVQSGQEIRVELAKERGAVSQF